MGVRHREYIVEGVQFHPESILTAGGRLMLRNFLKMKGGTWNEQDRIRNSVIQNHNQDPTMNGSSSLISNGEQKESILDRIFTHRRAMVAAQKQLPSRRLSDLQAAYEMNLAPTQISFPDRLRESPFRLALMAEVKRASPSKGDIALDICAPAQGKQYALAGASVISVLTEPKWFKGSMDDLRSVRQCLEGMPNRPAILAKEFIFVRIGGVQ